MTPKQIFLCGFRGSGKSTVGRILAQKLGFDFVEMDAEIEEISGQKIAELTQNGKEWGKFRQLELELLKSFENRSNIVVSCGGGVGVNSVNGGLEKEFLDSLKQALVVVLCPTEEVLWERLQSDFESKRSDHRPSLTGNSNANSEVEKFISEQKSVWRERESLYLGLSKNICRFENESPEELTDRIVKYLN
jgi:shikimate kinase